MKSGQGSAWAGRVGVRGRSVSRRWSAPLVVGVWLASVVAASGQDVPATQPSGATPPAVADSRFASLADVPGYTPGMSVGELLEESAKAAREGRLADAEKIVSAVAAAYPDNLPALLQLAKVYQARANEATDEAEKRGWLDNIVRTYLHAAPEALEAGQVDMANQMYRAVLRLTGDMIRREAEEPKPRPYPRAWRAQAELGLGRVLHASRQDLAAIERYREYLRTPIPTTGRGGVGADGKKRTYADQDTEAMRELGQIYRQNQLLMQAITVLEAAREVDRADPEVLLELALAYQDSMDHEKALKLVDQALDNAPRDRRASYLNTKAQLLLNEIRSLSDAQRVADNIANAKAAAGEAIQLGRVALAARRGDRQLLDALRAYYSTYRAVLGARLDLIRAGGGGQPETAAATLLEMAEVIRYEAALTQSSMLYDALAVLQTPDLAGIPGTPEFKVSYLETLVQLQHDLYQRDAAMQTCQALLGLEPDNAIGLRIRDELSGQARAGTAP